MTTKVIFAFDQDAGGITNFFELDSPVKGKLDNTTFTLGGAFSLVVVVHDSWTRSSQRPLRSCWTTALAFTTR